jgi:integrase
VENWYEIRKRGPTWQLIGRFAGDRVRLSLGTGDRAEAEQRAPEFWARVPDLVRPVMTLDRLEQDYVTLRLPRTAKPESVEQFHSIYRRCFEKQLGRRDVRTITYADLEEAASQFIVKGRAPATTRIAMFTLAALLRYAERRGAIERNPWDSELLPRLKRARPRPYSPKDIEVILWACKSRWHRWTVETFLATGLRKREATQLVREDLIDLPRQSLHVLGKGDKDRVIRLTPAARRLFRERRKEDRVWPLSYGAQSSLAQDLTRRCGFQVSTHRFRHTFGTRWIEAGGSILGLQRYMGHSTITQTEVYAELSQEFVDREVDRIFKR